MTKKRKLIVLELGHLSSRAVSGGDRLFHQIFKYLISDYQIEVITPSIALPHWQEFQKRYNFNIKFLKKDFLPLTNPVFIFLNYLSRIYQALSVLRKANRQEILYSSTNIFVDILPGYLFKLVNPEAKWVTRVLHLSPPPLKRKGNVLVNLPAYLLQELGLHLIRGKADTTLALNQDLYQILKQKRFQPTKLHLLGGGIDLEKIKKHHVNGIYTFDGVFLGRLHKTKGTFDLPEIWQRVTQDLPNAKLAIIGEGTMTTIKELKSQILEKEQQKNVQLLGYLPEKKVWDILKTAKVFLFTDYEAGWGLAVAEAMACGLPVVAYNLPIFGDIFKKGYVTVEVGDKNNSAKQILSLLRNKTEREKLSADARKQAQSLGLENVAQKYKDCLRHL